MKQVDTKAYMTALRSLTEQGHSVSVPVAGSSMSPFLAGGRDTVFFSRATAVCRKGQQLCPGDLLWEVFRGPWLWVIPLRRPIVRAWCAFKKRRT